MDKDKKMLEEELAQSPHFYTWVKDKNFKFVSCNENLAELCGLDSPKQIIGKTDYDLVWKNKAAYFRESDSKILHLAQQHINVIENIKVIDTNTTYNRVLTETDILISKLQLFNRFGNCIGITGAHINVTGYRLIKQLTHVDVEGNLHLGKTFAYEHLTKRETQVLKYMLYGNVAKEIATILNISHRTVESHIESIKLKTQSKTKGDIIKTCTELGLVTVLVDVDEGDE